ncbi:hypothetical protein RFI_37171, partial [Reticulomyxa filosa]
LKKENEIQDKVQHKTATTATNDENKQDICIIRGAIEEAGAQLQNYCHQRRAKSFLCHVKLQYINEDHSSTAATHANADAHASSSTETSLTWSAANLFGYAVHEQLCRGDFAVLRPALSRLTLSKSTITRATITIAFSLNAESDNDSKTDDDNKDEDDNSDDRNGNGNDDASNEEEKMKRRANSPHGQQQFGCRQSCCSITVGDQASSNKSEIEEEDSLIKSILIPQRAKVVFYMCVRLDGQIKRERQCVSANWSACERLVCDTKLAAALFVI